MLTKIQKTMDTVTTAIGAVLLAVMFLVIMANVVLRLIPNIGGFSWYMEFSQYANMWAMLIGAAGIAAAGTNLRVEVIDALLERFPWGLRVTRVIVDLALIVYYAILTWSGYELATRARQAVSTMPQFTMGQVYMIFPVAGILCIIGAVIHLLVTVTEKGKEEKKA